MRRTLLPLCAVLICFQCSSAQEKSAYTKNAPHVSPQDQKFVDMENVLWEAWKTKDRKPYEDLLSDKFFEVDVTGTYDKATEISYMDKCDLKDYAILDPQVRHLNDEAVLLTYKGTVHDICEGQPVPEHLIINIVFVREKGKWLKVLDSEVPQPAQQVRSTQSAAGNEDDIRGAQDALIAAYIHRDTATLDRILADEYTFINDDAGGVVNKKQILDSFSFRSGGDREITSYIRQDDQVRWYGDVAVLTYRYHSNETYKGRESGGDFRVTRIFVKRDGRWQIVGGQETRVNPQPDFTAVTSNDEHTLKQLEQEWLDAYREGDAEKMSRILADDFVGRWGDGSTTDKRGTVEPVHTGAEKHSANQLVECNVRIYGDTAVVTGIQTEQSVLEGRDGSGMYSYTDVFIKRNGRWQVVASETKRVARRSPTSELAARERLIGSWKQISSEESLPDGSVVHLDEIGLVTYDASGHMSGQAMRRSKPKQEVPSDSMYQSNGYDAYFGTFTLDEGRHTVTHHVEGSVARQLVGKDLVRSFTFDGERLILKPISADEHWTVVLEKIRSY